MKMICWKCLLKKEKKREGRSQEGKREEEIGRERRKKERKKKVKGKKKVLKSNDIVIRMFFLKGHFFFKILK